MAKHRLVVVDDHASTRRAVCAIFRSIGGWDVSEAGTVAGGLALLGSRPEPCCMLLDLDLPDGRGETVLERVRTLGLKTRVVVATGSMDSERLQRVASLKPAALLTKPISLSDVWDGLCRVCGVESSHGEAGRPLMPQAASEAGAALN